jgi:predicted GNAT family acetyltransferase
MDSHIEHDRDARRFLTFVEGHRAVLDYRLEDGVMTITHTGVPGPIEGRGVAASLVQAALAAARAAGWKVDPQCAYAAAYVRRHAGKYSDLTV